MTNNLPKRVSAKAGKDYTAGTVRYRTFAFSQRWSARRPSFVCFLRYHERGCRTLACLPPSLVIPTAGRNLLSCRMNHGLRRSYRRSLTQRPGPWRPRFENREAWRSPLLLWAYTTTSKGGLWSFNTLFPFPDPTRAVAAGAVRKCKSAVTICKARTYRAAFCTARC